MKKPLGPLDVPVLVHYILPSGRRLTVMPQTYSESQQGALHPVVWPPQSPELNIMESVLKMTEDTGTD